MTPKLKPLNEQVIVITGASSGIGLVTARTAARKGAKVMLVARSEAALQGIVGEIRSAGGEADYHVADVGDLFAVQAAADATVARFGRIDTWVNDAGVAIYSKLLATPPEEHERLFRTNYFGVVHGCLAASSALREAGGAIVTVGSVASDIASPVMGAYSASKHAVEAYVTALRMELTEAGAPIAVSLVKPSGIDTPIGQHATNHEGGEAQIPPPVYDPQLVADAILDCAVTGRRDVTVGGAGKAQVLAFAHFPRLMEWLAPKAAKSYTDDTKTQPTPSNLFEGDVRAGQERSGEQRPRRTSLYTAAALHPKTTAAATVGVVLGAVSLLFVTGRDKGSR